MKKSGQQNLELNVKKEDGPVECLGMTFENNEARRAYFTEKLREKLKDPEFRKIAGFPIGEDKDILALSDPPYYTACPNPFLNEYVSVYGRLFHETENYHKEPFFSDVREGKSDPIYNGHSYATKVPHKAIMRYILQYTNPGDLVLDGFAGTGMSGLAAQLCGDQSLIEDLGYRVTKEREILDKDGKKFSKIGHRLSVLVDLSTIAGFISYNFNTPINEDEFKKETKNILSDIEENYSWMFFTLHQPNDKIIKKLSKEIQSCTDFDSCKEMVNRYFAEQTKFSENEIKFSLIHSVVWTDIFLCPECGGEINFWDVALDQREKKILDHFECPHCSVLLSKRKLERAWTIFYDEYLDKTVKQSKQEPAIINYYFAGRKFEKKPDIFDKELLKKIDSLPKIRNIHYILNI